MTKFIIWLRFIQVFILKVSLSDLITHVDRLTKKNNEMKKFLQLAKDCKTDNEKIKFLDNFLN